ncbi:hypothetical protein FACS1894110_09890 [Spirochaetia bacterium]|nr:hypothetical protein FACS1894110_09890 [Spirochaetia bacterium]
MANIVSNSLAAGVSVTVKNEALAGGASVLPRKIVIFATPLETNIGNVPLGFPKLALSPDEVGALAGNGSMAHRLAIAAFRGANGEVPISLVYEEEAAGAVAATWTLTYDGTPTVSGSHWLYIAGDLYQIPIAINDTPTVIGDRVVNKVLANPACPVTAVNVSGVVTFTAKTKGAWGNGITIRDNQRPAEDQTLPAGLTAEIAVTGAGTLNPDFATDLPAALGAGDSANEKRFTDLIHGYGQDNVILDALSNYVGPGNDYTGLYSGTVARPLRSIIGNVDTGSDGLSAVMAFADNRKQDRTNHMICKPGSLTHPAEIGAEVAAIAARVNNAYAEGSTQEYILSGVDPGIVARQQKLTSTDGDWTTEYTNRDMAVKAGVATTIVEDGSVMIEDLMSFYHPSSIAPESNAYRFSRNISLTQNVLVNFFNTFDTEKWKGFTIVADKSFVQSPGAKVRDRDDVVAEIVGLVNSFGKLAWLYRAQDTIDYIAKNRGAITLRPDGTGFSISLPLTYSGIGNKMIVSAFIDTAIRTA